MKRFIIALGVVLLVGAVAAPVLARGPGWGRGHHGMGYWGSGPGSCWDYGKGQGSLTEEQRTQLENLDKKFYDGAAQLRDDIWSKSGEFDSLLNSANPDKDKAMALLKEISGLKAKMAQERLSYELEARKINPDARLGWGYERGYGRHMKGYGGGMGRGSHMGGYGAGPCWD